VQEGHLRRAGVTLRHQRIAVHDRIKGDELRRFLLDGAGDGGRLAGIAVDLDGRCVVVMHREHRRVLELGRQQLPQVDVDLAEIRRGA